MLTILKLPCSYHINPASPGPEQTAALNHGAGPANASTQRRASAADPLQVQRRVIVGTRKVVGWVAPVRIIVPLTDIHFGSVSECCS